MVQIKKKKTKNNNYNNNNNKNDRITYHRTATGFGVRIF